MPFSEVQQSLGDHHHCHQVIRLGFEDWNVFIISSRAGLALLLLCFIWILSIPSAALDNNPVHMLPESAEKMLCGGSRTQPVSLWRIRRPLSWGAHIRDSPSLDPHHLLPFPVMPSTYCVCYSKPPLLIPWMTKASWCHRWFYPCEISTDKWPEDLYYVQRIESI